MINLSDIRNTLGAQWQALLDALAEPKADAAALTEALAEARSRQPAPVVWLLGRAQTGKTSIIRALTGSPNAEIGDGFRPCTRTARLYDFPAVAPVVHFLDTRGLGEVAYDPAEDMAWCESQAHLVLAVVRALEPAHGPVFEALHAIRERHPDWPVLLAQTTLHEGYPPGTPHVLPYPYGRSPLSPAVPEDLARALAAQRAALDALPGPAVLTVPLDFTLPDDGFEPADYGLPALWDAIETALPAGLHALLAADPEVRDLLARTAQPHIRAWALASAALGALPAAGAVAVPAAQAKLLHNLATLYGLTLDRRLVGEFLGALGAGVGAGYLARWAGREIAKLIPGWGQTVGAAWGAATAGASTWALGEAAAYWFGEHRQGRPGDPELLRRHYAEALARGTRFLEQRALPPAAGGHDAGTPR